MSTAVLHTAFQHTWNLDHAELSFLSVLYYQQRNNDRQPVSPTQTHIQNMTGVGIYAQRRVRKSLARRGLMTEQRTMQYVEGKGHRTTMVYDIACDRLDALLAEVEARKASKSPSQERESIRNTTAADIKPSTTPPVRMHQEWSPDADALASYLSAYEIDARFAIHDVLPEFVDYWTGTERSLRPVQWQARFHAEVKKQWTFERNRQYNQAKILQASDLKANAIVAVKNNQTRKLMDSLTSQRRQPTTEELMSLDWVGKYDFGLDSDWV